MSIGWPQLPSPCGSIPYRLDLCMRWKSSWTCFILTFHSGGSFFRHLLEKWIYGRKEWEKNFTQKKMALVQKVIRTHFPHAVYGTYSSCCKRLRNRSRMHTIFFHIFCVLQLNSLLHWGQKKKEKGTLFCFLETQHLFIISEFLPDYSVFFAAPSKIKMTSIEVEVLSSYWLQPWQGA